MTLSVTFEPGQVVVMRARGILLRAEVDAAKRKVHDHMQTHGRQHALVLIEDGFTNLEAFASWEDIDVDHYIQQHVIRLAVVGDLRWRDTAVLFFMNAVSQFQIEYFKAGQEEFARAWLIA
jgi:hypothetical protein